MRPQVTTAGHPTSGSCQKNVSLPQSAQNGGSVQKRLPKKSTIKKRNNSKHGCLFLILRSKSCSDFSRLEINRSSFWILETIRNNGAALSVRLENQTAPAHAATQTSKN